MVRVPDRDSMLTRLATVAAGVSRPSLAVAAFWLVVAARFRTDAFATSFALAVVATMLGELASAGLPTGATRLLPRRGSDAVPVIVRMGLVTGAAAAVLGLIFVLGVDIWAPDLLSVRASVGLALVFVAATAASVTFRVAEAVLTTVPERAPALWWARAGVSVGRLVLALILSAGAGPEGETAALVSWALPLVVAAAALATLAYQWLGPPSSADRAEAVGEPVVASILSHRRLLAAGRREWIAGAAGAVAVGIVVLLALARLELAAAARYFVVWVVVGAGLVLVDEGIEAVTGSQVRSDQSDDRSLTRALGTNVGLALAAAVFLALILPAAVALLGDGVGDGVGGLRALSLLVVPAALISTAAIRLLAEDRPTAVAGLRVGVAVVAVLLAVVLVGSLGTVGLVLSWLLAYGLAAAACALVLTAWWWAARLDGTPAAIMEWLVGRIRWVRLVPDRGDMNRQVRDLLPHLYATTPDWTRQAVSPIRQTLMVAGHDGRPPLRLELARTPVGAGQLARRRSAVSEINGLANVGSLRPLVPFPIDQGQEPSVYLVESVVSGEPGNARSDAALLKRRVEAVTAVVGELHAETAHELVIDEAVLDHWVAKPLRRLGDSVRIPDADLARAAGMMFEGLNGKTLRAGRIHGSLRLDQALFDAGGDRLKGLISWEWSEPGPIALDWGVLGLSAVMAEEQRDLGPVVRRLLDEPATLRLHPAFASPLGDAVPPRVLVLLAWLQYTRPIVAGYGSRGLSRYWEARNIRPVLSKLLTNT